MLTMHNGQIVRKTTEMLTRSQTAADMIRFFSQFPADTIASIDADSDIDSKTIPVVLLVSATEEERRQYAEAEIARSAKWKEHRLQEALKEIDRNGLKAVPK